MKPQPIRSHWRFSHSALVVLAILGLPIQDAYAAPPNRIICITGDNSTFANFAEGYARSTAIQDLGKKTIASWMAQRGGDLVDCLGKVKDGDELIVIAHGCPGTLTWHNGTDAVGDTYTDFANQAGISNAPVPQGFDKLSNVKVSFVTCYSCSKPQDDQDKRSICNKLMDAMNGGRKDTGNMCSGFDNEVGSNFLVAFDPKTAAADKKAAEKCLAEDVKNNGDDGTSFANNAPQGSGRRPSQLDAARDLLAKKCPGAKDVKITGLIYVFPQDAKTGKPPKQCP